MQPKQAESGCRTMKCEMPAGEGPAWSTADRQSGPEPALSSALSVCRGWQRRKPSGRALPQGASGQGGAGCRRPGLGAGCTAGCEGVLSPACWVGACFGALALRDFWRAARQAVGLLRLLSRFLALHALPCLPACCPSLPQATAQDHIVALDACHILLSTTESTADCLMH